MEENKIFGFPKHFPPQYYSQFKAEEKKNQAY